MKGKRRALLISTDTYQDSTFGHLNAPTADLEALSAVLTDPAIGGYEVELLSNSPSHQVSQAIDGFFDEAGRDDLVILYFSGHGVKDDNGRLYLVTTDSRTRRLASTAISTQFIREQLDHCRCRSKIVILDCCYAGAFPEGVTRGDDAVDMLGRLSGRGSAVMTAASAIGYALEGGVSPTVTEINGVVPSVFTGALIDGLATGSADQDGDGLISVDELYDYVYKKVRDTVPQQTPGWRGSIEGTLYVATSPRGPRPAELPAELSLAVQNPLPSVRIAVVRDLVTLCTGTHPGTVIAVHAALTKLANDDSRRVAAAALAALEEVDERARAVGIQVKASRNPVDQNSPLPDPAEEAKVAAELILSRSQETADQAINNAQSKATKIEETARMRAEALERDAQERHRQAMGTLVTQREELERRVDALRRAADLARNDAREAEQVTARAHTLEAAIQERHRQIMMSMGLPDKEMEIAARVLTLAQETADQAINDAQKEATKIEETARMRAEALERDAQERHRQAMGSLVIRREELERRVDALRAFEREYRSRVIAYLEGQLRELTGLPATSAELPIDQALAQVDDIRAFERDYRSRLSTYLEEQLRDLKAGATDTRA